MMDDQDSASSKFAWGSEAASRDSGHDIISMGNDELHGGRRRNDGGFHDHNAVGLEGPLAGAVEGNSYEVDGQEMDGPNDYGFEALREAMATYKSISFRQWIKQALSSIDERDCKSAAHTPAYVKSALKIAISLTRQMCSLGKQSVPISTLDDWAEHIVVRLREEEPSSDDCIQQLKKDSFLWRSASGTKKDQIANEPIDPFLVDSSVGASKKMSAPGGQEAPDINKQVESFLVSFDTMAKQRKSGQHLGAGSDDDEVSLQNEDIDYLKVHSAEIQWPDCKPSSLNSGSSGNDEAQKIFHLGLVFYELFSGGDAPAPELFKLASLDGAFVSLPTLSLVEKPARDQSDSKRHHGPSTSHREDVGLCDFAFEYLQLRGVTSSLCHLVFNMLDCIYGLLSGEECYKKMSEVLYDLQLMMDKPRFLRNLDTDKLSLSDAVIIPRDEQVEIILSCYRHCLSSSSSEIAIITGESGCGKSWVAHRVGEYVAADGRLFLKGKFDQMQQAKQPFFALTSAFDQYCDLLLQEKGSTWATNVSSHLQAVLGKDAYYLFDVIPKLPQVLDVDYSHNESDSDLNCRNAVQRLHHLICLFVDVISAHSNAPLALFLDDVQWIDKASVSVLNRLLNQHHNKLFFIFCCRESYGNNPFWELIKDVCAIGINATAVELKCMTADALNEVISELLCLSPRIVEPLSQIIYHKTKGNVLFFLQLLHSLNSNNNWLYYDFDKKRWVWDREQILPMKLPDDVAQSFTNDIGKLPADVQSALNTLSMFGNSALSIHLKILEVELDIKLIEPLHVAETEGLVSYMNGSFRFTHDRIQETCYQLIEEHERRCNHLTYGKCLIEHQDAGQTDMLFTAINQVNIGGPAAIDPANREEYFHMASHNLCAGKRAMAMSDFACAYTLFDHGLSFLRKNNWRDYYYFSLELYELAAQCSLAATGNSEALRILSSQILNNARCFEDKLNIFSTIIYSLAYASKIKGALEQGMSIVAQLGEPLPSNPTHEMLEQQIQETRAMVENISKDTFLNYKSITDRKKMATLKLFAQMQFMALNVQPILYPFMAIKMVQITISDGLSPLAPVGFACFASLLAKRGFLQEARRCTVLARSLLEIARSKESAGEVLCGVAEVQCYLEPLGAANELRIKGESAAVSSGDFHWACLIRLQYLVTKFWAGEDLLSLAKDIHQACLFMKEHQHESSLVLMLIMQRTALMLSGDESDLLSLHDLSKRVQENKSPRQAMVLSINNLYLSFMLKNQGDMKELCEAFLDTEVNGDSLTFTDAVRVFVVGLASFQVYREHRDQRFIRIARKCKKDIGLWAQQGCKWNFDHKLLLFDAEDYYCNGNLDRARESYTQSITSAQEHRFVNDEALACELAAKFYLDCGDIESSREHIRAAYIKYKEWGANRKAEEISTFANDRFGDHLLDDA